MITENDKKYIAELWECYQNGIKELNIQNKTDEKELFEQLIKDAVEQIKGVAAEQIPVDHGVTRFRPSTRRYKHD